jgi:eukaryotic-like serine/threonine-protein kinase
MGGAPKLEKVGRYEVIRRLEGPGREWYLARQNGGAATPVLLIVFEMRPEDAKLVRAEVERCKRLEHPAIVRVLELLEHQGRQVLVCENPVGAPLSALLSDLLREHEVLADRAAFHLGRMLFGGLAAAHAATDGSHRVAPLVHGQLGPHQVFLSRAGDVQLTGFGLSRVFRLAEGVEGQPEVARPFLAPEVKRAASPSVRSNVYSAAAMLWALLARRGAESESAVERLPLLGELRTDLPVEITQAIDQALEPSVVRRAITAREIAAAFDRVATEDGKRELGWNAEVLQAHDASGDDAVPPPESFPPRALSDAPEPPSSESDAPTGQWRVPDRDRLRKLIEESEVLAHAHEKPATPSPAAVVPRPASPPPPPLAATSIEQLGFTPTPESIAPASRSPESMAPASRSPESMAPASRSPESMAPASRSPESMAPASRSPSLRPRAQRARARARLRPDGTNVERAGGRTSLPPAHLAVAAGPLRTSLPPLAAATPPPGGGPQELAASLSPLSGPTVPGPAKGARPRRGRWRARVANAGVPVKLLALFALTAVVSFAAGLIVASGPVKVSVGHGPAVADSGPTGAAHERNGDPPGQTAARSATSAMADANGANGATAGTSDARDTTASRGTSQAGSVRAGDDGDDGSSLPADLGYLVVSAPDPDAQVYVGGEPAGRASKKLVVRCGLVNVRLGTLPLHTWYGKGKAVSVACQGVTAVNMEKAKAMASGPATPGKPAGKRRAYWAPDDI